MSTNTLSKKAETRLIDFFNNTIDRKDMAKVLRQVNYILALGVIKEEGATDLEDNFYWLNELAEVLNPYLDKE
ncbi:hypothetical protein ACHRV5_17160 [Flavobacterium sp. FlaQc-52]|jgi:hypothetical protein|uniref:Uncharacterized protein n=1 Tax=Flavobacterium cupriresistens TaxID=2893885 RepID=A0ABU4RGV5_9FLAO|nr:MULTISPECIES: hypothetical protein [unclassified Flavobacterium]MDX6191811.1 hypothetical protein [Flavobacterium sp. Fl-318]UFH41754.1 hypothetical protein LNP23_18280 [Flavobacterium sp. F-323]